MNNYSDNNIIKTTVKRLNKETDERYTYMIADVMMHRMYEEGIAPMPMDGDNYYLYTDSKGRKWIPLFTSDEEVAKGECPSDIKVLDIRTILLEGLNNPDLHGVIINPFDNSRKLVKDTIAMVFEVYKKEFPTE